MEGAGLPPGRVLGVGLLGWIRGGAERTSPLDAVWVQEEKPYVKALIPVSRSSARSRQGSRAWLAHDAFTVVHAARLTYLLDRLIQAVGVFTPPAITL